MKLSVVMLVVVVVAAAGLCSAQESTASFEDSTETFIPSSLIDDSPFSFRPVPRGGHPYEFTGRSFSSPSSHSFPPPPSFPSPSSSFSDTSLSSYSTFQPSSPSSSFSSPSFSSFSSPSPSLSFTSSSGVGANGVKFLDTSAQDSHESFLPPTGPSLGYSAPRFSPAQNSHGVRGLVTPPTHNFGDRLPTPSPAPNYQFPSQGQIFHSPTPGPSFSSPSFSPSFHSSLAPAFHSPTPAPTFHSSPAPTFHSSPAPTYNAPSPTPIFHSPTPAPTYSAPSPTPIFHSPTPAPTYNAPSPTPILHFPTPAPNFHTPSLSPHHHGSQESFSSVETFEIDNDFDDSHEGFITSSNRVVSPSGTSNRFNPQPISFSSFPDISGSHETFSRPNTFDHSSSSSLPSFEVDSSESFHPQHNLRSSSPRLPAPSINNLPPSNNFRSSSVGLHSVHDSDEISSTELFLRTRGRPRQGTRRPTTNFVGAHPNYYFNYDVNASVEDGGHSSSSGQRNKRGPNFGHSERRENGRTEGRYYVELPDGRTQVVEYYADKTGYYPTITYI